MKKEVNMGKPPVLHFLWILMDLGTQLGAKLGRKIEPRQAKTGQDKGRQRKGREGRGKEERGRDWKGKGPGRLSLGGGSGFTHPLRGDLHWFILPLE